MSVTERRTPARVATWGWGIVATLAALLIVNAGWLYFAAGTAGMLEADTGVSASEFRAAYPAVADELASRGRTLALLLGGLAALALAVAIAGVRTGSAWARNALWVFAGALFAIAANALVGGRADIGSFYFVLAILVGSGLVLSGRTEPAA